MRRIIYFVTTNTRKYQEYAKFFAEHKIHLIEFDMELVEPQLVDSFEIIQHKLQQARNALPNKNVLVDDRGFNINALNDFPGPMLKLVLNTIGVQGIHKLMRGETNRNANFVTTIGYYDGRDEHYFRAEESGFLTQSPVGNNLHGWTELLYMYGHNSQPGKSLAELNDVQWRAYLEVISDDDVLKQLEKVLA